MNSIELEEVAADIHAADTSALRAVGTIKFTINEAAEALRARKILGKLLRTPDAVFICHPPKSFARLNSFEVLMEYMSESRSQLCYSALSLSHLVCSNHL